MYSETIEKICCLCVNSCSVKGSATHMKCKVINGYTPIRGTCPAFKYDILKKQVRRRTETFSHDFDPKDFVL